MGAPKPLLPWRGATLVERQVETLLEGGASNVVVVLGHRADEVAPYVQRTGAQCVINKHYRDGRTSSIKAGLDVVPPDSRHVLMIGVDQPRTPQIVSRVVRAHVSAGGLLTSPRYRGRGGHPLMFSIRLLPELKLISEENHGLREVFERHRSGITEVHFDDPMVRLDLNTPEAYHIAYETYGRPDRAD